MNQPKVSDWLWKSELKPYSLCNRMTVNQGATRSCSFTVIHRIDYSRPRYSMLRHQQLHKIWALYAKCSFLCTSNYCRFSWRLLSFQILLTYPHKYSQIHLNPYVQHATIASTHTYIVYLRHQSGTSANLTVDTSSIWHLAAHTLFPRYAIHLAPSCAYTLPQVRHPFGS